MKDEDPRLAAARNNAAWCHAVARSHGAVGRFDEDAWTCPTRTPTYYPDAVTLADGVDPARLLARIDVASPGASVKDSFAALDLAPYGFKVLFDARWIARPAASPPPPADALRWARIAEAYGLAAWEEAWRGDDGPEGTFRPELLADPSIAVLAGRRDGRVVAGAVVHRAAGVLGVGNVFASSPDDSPWAGSIALASRLFLGLPLVGYESGDDLAAACRHGFRPIGGLRVWAHAGTG